MRIKSFPYSRVLVTGGTGLVGSHLVEALINKGVEVFVISRSIDPFSYFYTKNLHSKVVLIHGDIRTSDFITDLVNRYEISFIYHLAAQPIVTTAYRNPSETLFVNIIGTMNVLEALRLNSIVKGAIIASSDKAYGSTESEYLEDHQLKGLHPYDVSKSSADLITQAYIKTYNTPAVITRFGNIYGEGDRNFNRIIPGILQAIITKKELVIRSNGKYVREYLYVKDVVEGYIRLAEEFESVRGEAFNFGTHYRRSVLGLIADLETIFQAKIQYRIENTARNEIPYQALNWNKIHQKLNWQPQYSMQDIFPILFLWYSQYFESKSAVYSELSRSLLYSYK